MSYIRDGENGALTLSDIHGAARLAVDLTLLVTDVTESMQRNVISRPAALGAVVDGVTGPVTRLVYRSVRGVTRLAGGGLDALLGGLASGVTRAIDWPRRDAFVAVVNGVLGDHLAATGNPLAIPMQWRIDAASGTRANRGSGTSARGPARGRVVVMVHGLCMTGAPPASDAHDHAAALGGDLGADVLRLRYNSGLHVSTNGAALAALLEQTCAAWPGAMREIVLVGHSMGGLVIRSACAAAEAAGHRWLARLRAIVFLGTPHHGAPMERAGHVLEQLLGATPHTVALARLGRLRSAGITDLRHGSVLDADWNDASSVPPARHPRRLPDGVPVLSIAASASNGPPPSGRAPRGDGLVAVASAFACHSDPAIASDVAQSRRRIAYGTGHLELLASERVYRTMKRWLEQRLSPGATSP